jgi:2-oxoglutarate dehydrogenase E1 component
VKRVLLCTGKIYHELDARRNELDRRDTAIVRIEQLYPFHGDMLQQIVDLYPKGVKIEFVQEETYNGGAWLYVSDMVQEKLGWDRPGYIGRARSSTPATGSKNQHKKEQEQILTKAIGAKPAESDSKSTVAAAQA